MAISSPWSWSVCATARPAARHSSRTVQVFMSVGCRLQAEVHEQIDGAEVGGAVLAGQVGERDLAADVELVRQRVQRADADRDLEGVAEVLQRPQDAGDEE